MPFPPVERPVIQSRCDTAQRVTRIPQPPVSHLKGLPAVIGTSHASRQALATFRNRTALADAKIVLTPLPDLATFGQVVDTQT